MAILLVLLLLQIAAGAFVAGLDAGMGYNTWPLMDGQWIPRGLDIIVPFWKNLFENALTVQFNHRLLAYAIVLYAAWLLWRQNLHLPPKLRVLIDYLSETLAPR